MMQPLGIAEPLEREFQRVAGQISESGGYLGPHAVRIYDVLTAHFYLADFFCEIGEGIGGIGPRDINLLHSALSRQVVSFGQVAKWKTPYKVTATLFFGIIKNHPFHDANKRTAFLTAIYQLLRCGFLPNAKQKEFEELTVRVASNALGKYSRYESFKDDEDPEVRFIAEFFRRNTRREDKRYYAVTYNQLNTILVKVGYYLANPSGNFIDIMTNSMETNLWKPWQKQETSKRLGQIGFPGWKSQVGKGAIRTVRQVTGLTPENGVDSESFFHGSDPMYALIDEYRGPLKRLVDK